MIPQTLIRYIETEIIPRYEYFDKAHNLSHVQTGDGLLKVLALQIPGKKRMEADAFLRGYQIETGCELSSQMIKNC